MKLISFIFICFLTVHLPDTSMTQTRRIDNLKMLITKTADRDERLKLLFLFCDECLLLNRDTLYAYANAARQLAQVQQNDLQVIKALS